MNYQLARTNVNLGGQMKWDLICTYKNKHLQISDFHLTPISDYVPYNYQTEEDLLNHTHLENIKKFYHKIPKDFFRNVTDPKLTTGYPLQNNGQPMKAYDDTYICGIKREKFSKYHKQFSYFCPIWVESIEDLKGMRFCINLFNDKTYKDINGQEVTERMTILKKYIEFQPLKENEAPFHNKFINYLYKYLDDIKLNDDLCSLKFTLGESYIKGVNAEYGIVETKDTSYVLNNIIDRERPLLEFDNMLIQQFSSNKIIARQLFNFNFIFDITDLLSTYTDYMGEGFNCEMFVEVPDKKIDKYNRLEFKDFFTNYEYINKMNIYDYRIIKDYSDIDLGKPNCLDYLQDYRCIDFIDKNKITPQTFHWALLDNNDYLFQLYDGFAPNFIRYVDDKTEENVSSSHKFFDMPDVWDAEYNFLKNNINWCKFHSVELHDATDILHIEDQREDEIFTEFDLTRDDVCWANSLKYDLTQIKHKLYWPESKSQIESHKIQICIFHTTFDVAAISQGFLQKYKPIEGTDNKIFYFIDDQAKYNRVFILITESDTPGLMTKLTFKKFRDLLNHQRFNIQKDYTLTNLRMVLNNLIKPTFIFFNKSLSYKLVNTPIQLSDKKDLPGMEIQYYKNDNVFNYIIRYDGKIRPCFISTPNKYNYLNYQYFYKNNNDFDYNTMFNKYTLTKFSPTYPSRDYFAIDKIQLNYKQIDKKLFCLGDKDILDENIFEWKWFNDNKFLFLHPIITLTITEYDKLNIGNKEELAKEIKNNLKAMYKVSDKKVDYIYNQYNIEYDYEYKTKTNVDDYIYKIKMILK